MGREDRGVRVMRSINLDTIVFDADTQIRAAVSEQVVSADGDPPRP